MSPNSPASKFALLETYLSHRGYFNHALLLGFFVNLLALAVPLHMLQVYDRVLTSAHVETLVAITGMVFVALTLQGALDYFRQKLLQVLGEEFEHSLRAKIFRTSVLDAHRQEPRAAIPSWSLCQTAKNFMSSPWMGAILDLPWVPIYIVVIYQFHPWLGNASIVASILMVTIATLSYQLSKMASEKSVKALNGAREDLEISVRNAEAVRGLGMMSNALERWFRRLDHATESMKDAQGISSKASAASKFFRLALQVVMLSLGAYLVINQEMSPGGIIANSIMLNKALSSFELIASGWKNTQEAFLALSLLGKLRQRPDPMDDATSAIVKQPAGRLSAISLGYVSQTTRRPLLSGLSFEVERGDVVAVIGPSGSGKSTLIRLMIGAIAPTQGVCRHDASPAHVLGNAYFPRHVGYVPQQVLLYPGTVMDNIARLGMPDPEQVLRAARAAGCEDMIHALPKGFETEVGHLGGFLSLGQQQRIALARALYGDPSLLFLDEPNSNLDGDGDEALKLAIKQAADRGVTVMMVAHRSSMLQVCNKVLIIRNGQQVAFGPRDDILRKVGASAPASS